MLLQTDNIIDHEISYNGYYNNSWKISDLRSWLNGYSNEYNYSNVDYSSDFNNFPSVAFFEDEYDICQLYTTTRGEITTSDYIKLPYKAIVTDTSYGFTKKTRQKVNTDYSKSKSTYTDWCLEDGYVTNDGYVYDDYHSSSGLAPMVKILVNSDQYYTSKPDLVMGTDISEADVTLKYDSTPYTGEAKTPKVTVKMNGETLTNNVDYTIKYSDNVNAGTAKVTVSGCGNYYGSVEKTFDIYRIDQSISRVDSSYEKVMGDSAFRLNAITSGDGAISYSSSDESVAIVAQNTGKVTITGVGTATITVTAAQTNSYNQATKDIEIKVLPKQVTGLKQSSTTTSSLKLSWSKVAGASGYEVYRYSPTQEKYYKIKTINSGNTTSFKDSKLSSGKTYKYKVRAFTNVGSDKYYGDYSSAKSTATKPAKTSITKMKFLIGARGWVDIKYKKVSCTGYEIRYAKNSKFRNSVLYDTKSSSYSIMENTADICYAKVRAYKICGDKVYYGSWSKAKHVKRPRLKSF
jgi:hypothetical protein